MPYNPSDEITSLSQFRDYVNRGSTTRYNSFPDQQNYSTRYNPSDEITSLSQFRDYVNRGSTTRYNETWGWY